MLTKTQFKVLRFLQNSGNNPSQRIIANNSELSVGTVNTVLKELLELNLIDENKIVTEKGKVLLAPYKVQRAVIAAAGFGSRLAPITLNTPKPLVRVKGKRLIDTTLEALIQADISEIYIVRGYLGEQFDQLKTKFPTIQFIENPVYNETNNISSIYFARNYLKNAYIMEADLLLNNKSLIQKYQYSSNILTIPVKQTDDWCVKVQNGIIKDMQIGGENCYKMCGISYLNEEDGEKLSKDCERIFNSFGGKELFWDKILFEKCKNNYKISPRFCSEDDIQEIDTFNELKKIDSSYNV